MVNINLENNANIPLITIIVPVYNIEDYIGKCLDSLLKQSYRNLEIIIIDDGSTDGSGVICDQYVKIDKRVKIIHQKNSGVSEARNLGIQCAQGEYLIFVDGDDYVSNNYVRVLINGILNNNVGLYCADYFLDNGKITLHSLNNKSELILDQTEGINMLHQSSGFQGYLWNKIFVREIIIENKLKFQSGVKIWEDMLFCLQYMKCINKIGYIKYPIYFYVQRAGSAVNDVRTWEENTHLKAIELMWNEVKNYEGDFKNYVRNFYANDLVGGLGKTESERNIEIIKHKIYFIEELNGRLSKKHKIKLLLFKYFPRILCKLYK